MGRNSLSIARQVVTNAIQRKSTVGDPVGIAPQQSAEVRVRLIRFEFRQRHYNIGERTLTIGHGDLSDDASIRHHANGDSV
jgi:hypothetical protein